MTAEDIIAANPTIAYRRDTYRKRECLRFELGGVENAVIWEGGHHVGFRWADRAKTYGAALLNLKSAQPGKEFKTVADDATARIWRSHGFVVVPDGEGRARVQYKDAAA